MACVSGSVENGSMVTIDESKIRDHVDEVIRMSVEETLHLGAPGNVAPTVWIRVRRTLSKFLMRIQIRKVEGSPAARRGN